MEDRIRRVGQDGIARHGDAELFAHGTAGTFAADHLLSFDLARAAARVVADGGADAVTLVDEIDQLGIQVLGDMGEPRYPARQHRIEEVLRAALALLRALRRTHFDGAGFARLTSEFIAAVEGGHPGKGLRMVAVVAGAFHLADDAPTPTELHRAYLHEIHLRLDDDAIGALDDGRGHTAPGEVAGEREAHGTCADDEDRRACDHPQSAFDRAEPVEEFQQRFV